MEQFHKFVEGLKAVAANDLPGWSAQSRMAPPQRIKPESWAEYANNARIGAVLILFYPLNESVHTVFIQRPTYDGVHSGQIAFPGGKREEGDTDIVQTALREAWEEVGVGPEQVEVIGALSEIYIPPSNFLVTPIMGICYEQPTFVPQPTEVESILEVDIKVLTDPAIASISPIYIRDNMKFDSPTFNIGGPLIWGATAMMISELNEVLKPIEW